MKLSNKTWYILVIICKLYVVLEKCGRVYDLVVGAKKKMRPTTIAFCQIFCKAKLIQNDDLEITVRYSAFENHKLKKKTE